MNTTELTSVEINRLVANAAGWFVDDEGDLCYLYTQEQRDAATTAEERLVNLVDGGAMDIASIDVRAIKSALGVNRVPADFERTIGRKLDSIQEQAEELAETTSTEISGVALEFTTDSSEVDGMNGQEWAGLVNEALAAAYPAVTFCDPNDLNLLTAGSGRPDVSDQINYDRFTECGAGELQELAAKSVVEVALSSTCRYCGTTVTWSGEANMPTDGNGMICCDGCYNEATGYGEFAEEGR